MKTLLAASATATASGWALAAGTWTTPTFWSLLTAAIASAAVIAVQSARLVPM